MLRTFFLIPVVLACFALLPTQNAFALTPAPDDGYNGWSTAESSGALFSLTTGDLTRPLVRERFETRSVTAMRPPVRHQRRILRAVTALSSVRFKDDIKPMGKTSEAILTLKPVTFRYKKELDPQDTPQFGLVAEEVAKVNPDLVKRDRDGKLQTVRYEAVNAMLLNEFLKEHRKVEGLEAAGITQQKEIAQRSGPSESTARLVPRSILAL